MARASFLNVPTGPQFFPGADPSQSGLSRMLSSIAKEFAVKGQQFRERRGLSEEGINIPGMEVPKTFMEKAAFALRTPTEPSDIVQLLAKTRLETKGAIDKARAVALAESGKTTRKTEEGLRKEFTGQSDQWKKIRDSFGRVEASAVTPSAAGDLALIFNYMKILDPGSVVRESEFANAAASGAWGSRIQAAGLKILRGERLDPVMRADFVNRAGKLFEVKKGQHGQLVSEYTRLAEATGVNPKNVIVEFGLARKPGTFLTKNFETSARKIEPDITELSDAELERLTFKSRMGR